MPKQLVAVDVHVADYQKLIDQLGDQYRFLVLTSESDPLGQLADFVSANPGFDAIHLISHGASGQIQLGSQTISGANVGSYAEPLIRIGEGVRASGDFLLYGCDVAQGDGGQQLITDITRFTRLDVAASTNKTGGSGDWVLEATTGSIQLALPELSYDGSLVVSAPTVAWTRLIGSTGDEYCKNLAMDKDGSIYISVWSQSQIANGQTVVTKFAPDGSNKVIGSFLDDGNQGAIKIGLSGDICFARGSRSLLFLTSYSPDGSQKLATAIGGDGILINTSLATGIDGAIYVASGRWSKKGSKRTEKPRDRRIPTEEWAGYLGSTIWWGVHRAGYEHYQ
jgi:hypothetical protein